MELGKSWNEGKDIDIAQVAYLFLHNKIEQLVIILEQTKVRLIMIVTKTRWHLAYTMHKFVHHTQVRKSFY
jgi:hypothetical protein